MFHGVCIAISLCLDIRKTFWFICERILSPHDHILLFSVTIYTSVTVNTFFPIVMSNSIVISDLVSLKLFFTLKIHH